MHLSDLTPLKFVLELMSHFAENMIVANCMFQSFQKFPTSIDSALSVPRNDHESCHVSFKYEYARK